MGSLCGTWQEWGPYLLLGASGLEISWSQGSADSYLCDSILRLQLIM